MKKLIPFLLLLFLFSCNEDESPIKEETDIDNVIKENSLLDRDDVHQIAENFDVSLKDFIKMNLDIEINSLDSIYFNLQHCIGLCDVDTSLCTPFTIKDEKATSILNIKGRITKVDMNQNSYTPSIIATFYYNNETFTLNSNGSGSFGDFSNDNEIFNFACHDLFYYFRNDQWTTIDWENNRMKQ